MTQKTAIIIGATGLVGSELLKQILENENYTKIKVFGRRKIEIENPKLEQYIIDFDKLNDYKYLISGDELFSALGTTRSKAKGTKNQYVVDFTYQFNFAKICADNKVSKYFLVSSAGANHKSKNFYMRMKGELDIAVESLNFDSIVIFRPSALTGKRFEKRIAENITVSIGNFLVKIFSKLRKFRPIQGYIVARAMINLANRITEQNSKVEIYQYEQIFEAAGISYMQKSIKIE